MVRFGPVRGEADEDNGQNEAETVLYIDADYDDKLKRLAKSRGVTESDVVRAAIEALPAPAIAGTRIVHRDPAAWAQARAFLKALAPRPSRPGASSTHSRTRDQLYDERVGRVRR